MTSRPSVLFATAASVCLIASLAVVRPASAEIGGKCGAAVGTFLTSNMLDDGSKTGTSRSLLVLTNGGHALRFDSDEESAAVDNRPFGDSAGIWRCDGVDENGTVRLTVTTLDFTFPGAEDKAQIARIDAAGTFDPKTETMELKGKLGFLPLDAAGQKADALAQAKTTIAVTLTGKRVELPAAP